MCLPEAPVLPETQKETSTHLYQDLKRKLMGLQIGGFFVYRWKNGSRPRKMVFSAPLLLLVLALKVVRFSGCIAMSVLYLPSIFSRNADVGSYTAELSQYISCFALGFCHDLLVLKSGALARVFETLDRTFDAPQPSRRKICKPDWVIFLAVGLIFSTAAATGRWVVDDMISGLGYVRMLLGLHVILLILSKAFTLVVFRSMLMLLVRYLQECVGEALLDCSCPYTPYLKEGEGGRDNNVTRIMLLERKVEEIGEVQAQITSLFTSSISLVLLSDVCQVIIDLYSTIQLWQPTFLPLVLQCLISIYLFCYTGQDYGDEVWSASRSLRQYSNGVWPGDFKTQLQLVEKRVEELVSVEMNGWFSLSNRTFVALVSFVATYVVVLLQVGSFTITDSAHGSPNTTLPNLQS